MDKVEINLKLTVAQVNIVLSALSKGAYAEVADVITNIRDQALPQVNAAQSPAAADEDQEDLAQAQAQ